MSHRTGRLPKCFRFSKVNYKKPAKAKKIFELNRLRIKKPEKPAEDFIVTLLKQRKVTQMLEMIEQQWEQSIHLRHQEELQADHDRTVPGQLLNLIDSYKNNPTPETKKCILSFTTRNQLSSLNYISEFVANYGTVDDFDFVASIIGDREVLNICCSYDRHDIFDSMVERGVAIAHHNLTNAKGTVRNTLLKMGMFDTVSFWKACESGNENEFYQLIFNGININETPWFTQRTPLRVALDNNQHAIVKTLQSLGAIE